MKWKKILLSCLTILFFISTFLSNINFAYAQTPPPNPNPPAGLTPAGTPAPLSAPAPAPTATPEKFEKVSCGWSLDFVCWAAYFSYNVLLTISSWIAGVSGLLYDTIINFTVLNMAANFDANKSFIEAAWIIMRDVVNILFLFVLLIAGIMTIINGFESGTSKKVATVVVVALLINFSMFFTKIIIDASNFISIEFYNSMKTTDSGGNDWQGIAGVFMEKLDIASIYSSKDLKTPPNDLQIIYISLGGSVILLVLAAVLFIASIMFLVRYIILIILLIASSAAIGSWILPSLKKSIFDKWWSALIGQAFFAPVFLFFIYLTLLITTELVKSSKGLSWSSLFLGVGENANPIGVINLVLNLLIVLGFLIGSIIVSKQLSNMAGSGAGKLNTLVGGAALGGAALLGRNVGGGLGSRLRDSKFAQGLAEQKGIRGAIGMGLLRTGDRATKGTWDLRNNKRFGQVAGLAGADLGKAGSNTYTKSLEASQKKYTGRADLIKSKSKEAAEKEAGEKLANDAAYQELEKNKTAASAEIDTKQKAIDGAKARLAYAKTEGDSEKAAKAQTQLQTAEKEMTEAKTKLAEADKGQTEMISKETSGIMNQGKLNYAERIKGTDILSKARNTIMFSQKARVAAATKIVKELDKNQSEKDFDSLKKLLSDIKKDGDK